MNEVSLMFAVEAEQLLLAGMPEEAIELCNQGLEAYPKYTAAISVLARAYATLGNKEEADNIINSIKEHLPANVFKNIKEAYNEFDSSFANIDSPSIDAQSPQEEIANFIDDDEPIVSLELETSPILTVDSNQNSDSKNDSDFDSDNIEEIEQEIIPVQEYNEIGSEFIEAQKNVESDDKISNENVDETSNAVTEYGLDYGNIIESKYEIAKSNNFDEIKASNLSIIPGLNGLAAKSRTAIFSSNEPVHREKVIKIVRKQSDFMNIITSLNRAEVIKPDYTPKNDRHKSSVVVTETIASILVQQGAFSEAKAAYLELSAKYPDKKKEFKKKIAEIDSKLK